MRISTLALAALMAGCVIDGSRPGTDGSTTELPGDGIVEVNWIVGSSGCELAGVSDVLLELGTYSNTVPCDNGTTRIQIMAGDYELTVTGLDPEGVARFQATEDLVSVFEGDTTVLQTLRLSALPATLTLFWKFENGSLCGANGVDNIDVALFTNEQLVAPFPLVVECASGEATFEDIASGAYVVSLLGLDEADQATFEARKEIELFRGETLEEELELLPLDDGETKKP